MNNMIFRNIHKILTLGLVLASCQVRDLVPDPLPEKDGIVLDFSVTTPDMRAVPARAVADKGVESLVLFCFDSNGKLIEVKAADEHSPNVSSPTEADPNLAGRFRAYVKAASKVIHLLGNQDISSFDTGAAAGKTEAEVMATLLGTADRMVYWGRVAATGTQSIADAFASGPVRLVRNMAKIVVNSSVPDFSVEGIALFSVGGTGTVAPYNRTSGSFDWLTSARDYLTLPPTVTLTDQTASDLAPAQYAYETSVNLAAPAGVIVKASGKFYKLLLQDSEGRDLPLLRNHRYTFTLGSKLNYPYASFDEAKAGIASNNVWATVSDEVNTIESGNERLSVDKTFVFIKGTDSPFPLDVGYSYTVGGAAGATPSVLWAEGNNVAQDVFRHHYAADGVGTVTLAIRSMGSENLRQGTLVVRTQSGLQRRIKVCSIREADFTPASASAVGSASGSPERQTVRLKFHIPPTIPAQYCPFKVLITAKGMDAAQTNRLDVITKETDPDVYGTDQIDGQSYKYVYTVEASDVGTEIYLDFVTTTSSAYTPAANPFVLESLPIFNTCRIPDA